MVLVLLLELVGLRCGCSRLGRGLVRSRSKSRKSSQHLAYLIRLGVALVGLDVDARVADPRCLEDEVATAFISRGPEVAHANLEQLGETDLIASLHVLDDVFDAGHIRMISIVISRATIHFARRCKVAISRRS